SHRGNGRSQNSRAACIRRNRRDEPPRECGRAPGREPDRRESAEHPCGCRWLRKDPYSRPLFLLANSHQPKLSENFRRVEQQVVLLAIHGTNAPEYRSVGFLSEYQQRYRAARANGGRGLAIRSPTFAHVASRTAPVAQNANEKPRQTRGLVAIRLHGV